MALNPDVVSEYCNAIEGYLRTVNGGPIIRITSEAFERVKGWIGQGIPLKIVMRGIDRHQERRDAKKQSRRRPIQIMSCENDVLDVFDEWRRAVGVRGAALGESEASTEEERPRHSLPAHLDRVIARLTAIRTGSGTGLDALLDATIAELDAARAAAKGLRGDARTAFVTKLAELDARLIAFARRGLDNAGLAALRAEAESDLAPFRTRMPAEVYARSLDACTDRLLRERIRLPVLTLD